MKILFVALGNSIHTARWIDQIADTGWDIHLFPSIDIGEIHSNLRNVTVHHSIYHVNTKTNQPSLGVKRKGLRLSVPVLQNKSQRYLSQFAAGLRYVNQMVRPNRQARRLARLIHRLQPDIIHTLELQHGGYLTLAARDEFMRRYPDKPFPIWIITNWGNDLYLYRRLKAHRNNLIKLLSACDYYDCECERDLRIARELGYTGEAWPVLPNIGGIDLAYAQQFRQPVPTSARRLIMVKGYQDWHGRSLFVLHALSKCARELQGYEIKIYSTNEDVAVAAELLAQKIDSPVEIIRECSFEDMLRYHGRSRVYIGNSISDGISISMLEAMVMGEFPIQSCTACVDEWIVDGVSGLVTEPEEVDSIAAAIRRALTDDELVDRAAEINAQVAAERLDRQKIRDKVIALYEETRAKGKRH